ncbi:DUF6188 family protein [Kitasatospora sp. NPDC085464]|uniref:DUF6188 family protein n=1 Tax=Kitasatospora sp. NPDC085464 TaxID=3364063 RepID=UPI0037C509D3
MTQGIARVEDGWRVPTFRGLGVGELVIDDRLRLRIGSNEIMLCSWAELVADERAYGLSAWPQTNLGKATELLRQAVAEVSVSDQGVLRVLFAGGWRLTAPANDERSAWTVTLGGRGFLTAKPGGGVTVSDSSSGLRS